MKNRPFVPAFLKKYDRKLLLHNPDCWSSRLHLVLYFNLLLIFCLSLLSYFAFTDAALDTAVYTWTSFTALVGFVGFVIWIIYLLRFNVFKRYGLQKPYEGLMSFLRYFLAVVCIVLPTYIPLLVESFRANRAYTSTEIVTDINRMNKNMLLLHKDILPTHWGTDTFQLVADNHPRILNSGNGDEVTVAVEDGQLNYINNRRTYLTEQAWNDLILESDSMVRFSDSLLVRYNVPDFAIFNVYGPQANTDEEMLGSLELYKKYVQASVPDNKKQWRADLQADIAKYYRVENQYSYYTPSGDLHFLNQLQRNYPIQAVNSGLYNIVEKKYRWSIDNADTYLRIIFYISLILSVLVFIFRHTTVRNFFWTALASVVLLILTAICLTFMQVHDFYVPATVLLYYVIFAAIAFRIHRLRVRKTVQGIALNLFTLATPFIPTFVFKAMNNYVEMTYVAENDKQYTGVQDYSHLYVYAEILGFFIFLILLQPVFKNLYRKWYALPEQ